MRTLPIWTLALAALVASGWPTMAQVTRDTIELRNQIYELQQQVRALQQQVGQGNGSYLGQSGYAPPQQSGASRNELVPQLLTQVQSLEGQVRDLRGQVDQLQNQVNQQNAELSKRIGDLMFQLQNSGGSPNASRGEPPQSVGSTSQGGQTEGASSPQTQAPPTASQTSPGPGVLGAPQATAAAPPLQLAEPPKPSAPRTPEVALRDGEVALARHDYPAAEVAAREVLTKFRTSPRAYDAQYLLAEALAGQHQFAQSAVAYDDTYNRSRKGGHAPEALIGLAYSLSAINEKRAACDTLVKLHTEFPHPVVDIKQAAATVGQRAGCKQ